MRATRTRHLGRLGSGGTETAARLQEIVTCRALPRKPLFESFRAASSIGEPQWHRSDRMPIFL